MKAQRALLYARYSSDRQEMTSIDDQIAMMTAHCDAQGWEVAGIHTDVAKSGRSMHRDGVQALLRAIEAGEGGIVVVEAVDRLTRRIADGLDTLDLFRHRSIRLVSVTEGEQDFLKMLITAMGAQLAAQNIGAHTQRALREGLKRGRLVSKAYGYQAVPGADGLNRAIDPREAPVIVRIFEAFAEGRAPDAIARDLNAEGITSPNGGTWHGSTIRGNPARGEGILRNPLYRGTAMTSRTQRSYHPKTGSKRVKATPDQTIEADFPELRIVPEPFWNVVQAELDRRAGQVEAKSNAVAARHQRYLLSGLLTCGCCGGSYVIRSRTSYGCHEAVKGACDNKRMISRRRLEARVLDRIRAVMRSAEVRAAFDAALAAERARLTATDLDGEDKTARTRRAEAQARLDAILAAIEDGAPYAAFKTRAKALADEIAQADARIATLAARRAARDAAGPDADVVFDRALAEMETLLGDPDLVEHARLERRAVLPSRSSRHALSSLTASCRSRAEHPLIRPVQISRATSDLKALFPGEEAFGTPKPEGVIARILSLATGPGDLVLDSFLGSGTTAAVAHKMGRRWIGVELGEHARTHAAARMVKVIEGEQGGISRDVDWQGGGAFRLATLGRAAFDAEGRIDPGIAWDDLAAHVWFAETRRARPDATSAGPLVGIHEGGAVALLWNGVLKDRSASGGNVLVHSVLRLIRDDLAARHPGFDGPLTVYGAATRLSPATLKVERITFKQTPYAIARRA